MNHSSRYNLTKLYNKLGVEMVVLIDPDEEDKIRARALLWHDINIGGGVTITLMDRIYATKEKDINLMKAYAESKGWWYKAKQSYDHKTEIMSPGDDGVYVERIYSLRVHTDGVAVERWPYVDTFTYANDDCSFMTNDYDIAADEGEMYALTSTGGGRNELEDE